MFGLSLTHLILFGIIALIFIGPDQLPEVARTLARILGELRRATADLQNQFTGQFKDHTQAINELRNQLTNFDSPAPPPPSQDHEHREGGHGPEAHTGESTPDLPTGAHPVSEDDKGKNS